MQEYKRYLAIALECQWLLAAFTLPLLLTGESNLLSQDAYSRFEVPKTIFIKVMVALILVTWVAKDFNGPRKITGLMSYLRHFTMPKLIPFSIGLLLASTILATIFSGSITTSLWGYQPGNDPFSLYSTICYIVIFAAIATNLNTPGQIGRLLCAVTISGSIVGAYGVLEFLTFDFLGTNETIGFCRISSTLGNSLIAGSFLLISIGVSLAALFYFMRLPELSETIRKVVSIAISTGLVLQISAMIFTNSRGPWVATITLVALFVIAGFIVQDLKKAVRNTAWIICLVTAAGMLAYGCTAFKQNSEKLDKNAVQTNSPVQIDDRISSIPSVVTEGGLNGRIYTWSNIAVTSVGRPEIPGSRDLGAATRFIFGYGPELMEFAFLLNEPPYGSRQLPATPDQAHNIFLHYWIEQGLVGLVSSLMFFAIPLVIVIWIVYTRALPESVMWLSLGCCIVLLSHSLEQQVGISKVTDLTLYFLVLGLLYALTANSNQIEEPLPPATSSKSFQIVTLAAVTLISVSVTITQSTNYLSAGLKAADGQSSYTSGNWAEGYDLFNTAIDLAPRIPVYYHYQNAYLKSLGGHAGKAGAWVPDQCFIHSLAEDMVQCIYLEIYSNAKEARQANPWNWNTTYEAATAAYHLKQDQEAIALYSLMLQQAPKSYPLKNHVGIIHFALGDYLSASTVFEESLKLTVVGSIQSRTALMYTGLIQAQQGNLEQGYNTLLDALNLYLEARETEYGFGSDPQENQDILTISLELNNIAKQLDIEPPIKIQ